MEKHRILVSGDDYIDCMLDKPHAYTKLMHAAM